ncbi:MAG: TenA family transcriptional regulator [Oscillatoria sp. PMC 1051.18]|uniref:TenA family transcriptional regulator n=1 Tax=Oscillatoria salina TaxID=331517 RepID=UPI0013B9C99F|nr:TenA family transcriptional regulator [Oscillatoria salina]MBZ8179632.1 TenA family transcriptional regulator [Oscillatoria salina IIICB1]MEC4892430.1 TenA family transcriptional regulator [Oscillatoria sp. PMC 1050.18]MEC5028480.1 TenA family transcriptional regulator [Oscillatoria sp. PMC 1051.18]NET90868.1 TenA family transcriptional regulator [Kamptonema sp. SIO1D9]
MTFTCSELLEKHPQAWQQATVHPFLAGCKSGTIQDSQFDTWLVQDYLFVIEFTRFVARVLANAPADNFEIILGGLSALKAELNWFQTQAKERKLTLETDKQPTCQEYCEYLEELADKSYPVQATAFWAIELAYNQAWQLPGKMSPAYQEFSDRWGNPDFTEYVQFLEKQADRALFTAKPSEQQQAQVAFLQIAHLEKDFWQMAFNAS